MKNKIIYLNIIIIAIILFILFLMNKYSVVMLHGYIYPWMDLGWRIPSQIFESTLNNILPLFFKSNPNDFRSGFALGSVILSGLYIVICYLFAKGFFLHFSKESNDIIVKSILLKKEFLLIFPLSFLTVSVIFTKTPFSLIYRFNDLATSVEYFFGLIFYFLFLMKFYEILFLQNKLNGRINTLFYILISFILGNYNELFNLSVLFFLFSIFLFISIFERRLLKNKEILFLIIPFFIGLVFYYLVFDNYTNSLNHYGITSLDYISYIKENFSRISHIFWNVMFRAKYVWFFLIIILSFLGYKLRVNDFKNTLFFIVSIVFGYILTNFLSSFRAGINASYEFMFERTFWQDCYINILEWVILILIGCLFSKEKIRKYIIIFLIAVMVFLSDCFIKQFQLRNEYLYSLKKTLYTIDKYSLVYTALGESVILPEKFLLYPFRDYTMMNTMKNEYNPEDRLNKDRYINAQYLHYHRYFNRVYETKLIGVIFKDDEFAHSELEKRLILFDDSIENDNQMGLNKLNFDTMSKKYKGRNLSIKELEEMKVKQGASDIIDKAMAFVYFNEGDYEKSLKLYLQYLSQSPNDIDALLHIAEIYKITGKFEKSESMYKKLLEIDNNNLLFNYNLMCLYFNEMHNYDKAIEICKKMIKNTPELHLLYVDMAILYSIKGDDSKKDEYYKKALELSTSTELEWGCFEKSDNKPAFELYYPDF